MKKSRLLCMILTAAMLFSMVPMIALPATAERAASLPLEDAEGRPLYLPDHRVEDETNDKDGIWLVGYGYTELGATTGGPIGYNDGTTINTQGCRIAKDYDGAIPLELQGQAMSFLDCSDALPDNCLVSESADKNFSFSDAIEIPSDAVGFLVKVNAKAAISPDYAHNNTGVRFNPTITDESVTYTASSNKENWVFTYLWDSVNGVWSASLAEDSYRVPANATTGIETYIFIPFEIYRYSNAVLDIRGKNLTAFNLGVHWNGAEVSLEELQIVSAAPPLNLPGDPAEIAKYGRIGEEVVNNVEQVTWSVITGTQIQNTLGYLDSDMVIPENQRGLPYEVITSQLTENIEAQTEETTGTTLLNLATPITIPCNATGFLLQISGTKNDDYTGFRFNPTITHTYEDETLTERDENGNIINFVSKEDEMTGLKKGEITQKALAAGEINETKDYRGYQVYYYITQFKQWVVLWDDNGETNRLPAGFDGYAYIPFESFDQDAGAFEGGKLTQIEFVQMWGSTSTLESISIVTTEPELEDPATLPNLETEQVYLAGYHYKPEGEMTADQDPYNVFSHYPTVEEINKEKYGGIYYDETLGTLSTTNVTVNGKILLPTLTQGQKYTLQTIYDQGVTAIKTDGSTESDVVVENLSSEVPLGAVGFMLRVNLKDGKDDNCGIRFDPEFTFTGEDAGKSARTVKGGGGYIYYYNESERLWHASLAEHAYRLPENFDGYVYIPFETYQKTDTHYYYALPVDPHVTAEELQGLTLNAFRWAAVWAYTYPYAATVMSVSYVVLPTIKDTSLAVDNSLNFNLYVKADESFAQEELKVNFISSDGTVVYEDATGEYSAANNEYRFTYPDVLPQSMDEEFIFQLCSNDKPVSEKTISVESYCNTLINDTSQSAAVKKLAADILQYGAAAQVIAGIEHPHAVPEDATKDIDRTATVIKSITTPLIDNKKIFKNVRLRLDTEIALQLDLDLDTKRNVKVVVTLGDREVVYSNGEDGDRRLTNSILFDVMAHEFDEQITAIIYVNNVENQKLIYSVNTYLQDYNAGNAWDVYNEWDRLMDALFAYGVSASNYYAETVAALQVQAGYTVSESVSYSSFSWKDE